MTLKGKELPESKLNSVSQEVAPQVNIQSSDENDEDEEDEGWDVVMSYVNYQPLSTDGGAPNDGDISDGSWWADSSDDEEEDSSKKCETKKSEETSKRELKVDTGLVLNAMKNIKLDTSAIPPWAKEMSDGKWDKLIEKVQEGGSTLLGSSSKSK